MSENTLDAGNRFQKSKLDPISEDTIGWSSQRNRNHTEFCQYQSICEKNYSALRLIQLAKSSERNNKVSMIQVCVKIKNKY